MGLTHITLTPSATPGRRALRMVPGVLMLALAALSSGSLPAAAASPRAVFMVGADAENITPSPDLIAKKTLYLGGYGLSDGQVGPAGVATLPIPGVNGRFATGVMTEPLGSVFVRAVVISDGKRNLAFADLDNQGMPAAYKLNSQTGAQRPYGIDDIRSQVAADTHGALAFQDITVSSDHSHAGQDLTGVWGFVPDTYLAFVKSQAVKALETALRNVQPAYITAGHVTTPGPCDPARILNDQLNTTTCDGSDPNDVMDTDLRTMQGVAVSDGHLVFTLVNFAAHATVMGGGNTLVSPDWPGVESRYLEQRYGGVALTIVADVGRSQPNRGDCTPQEKASGAFDVDPRAADDSCRVSKYSRAVMAYVERSIAAETPLCTGGVDGRDLFVHDVSYSPVLVGLNNTGDLVGAPIARQNLPPYFTTTVLGTWVGVYRVGDLVITANPGEAYPNIRQQFASFAPGARDYWTIGLANDQLGYLVAPFPGGYPTVLRAGAVNGNDNLLFNVSPTIGDHVMCTQLKGAAAMGLAASPPAQCQPWLAEVNDTPDLALAPARGAAPTFPPPSPIRLDLSCGTAAATSESPAPQPGPTTPLPSTVSSSRLAWGGMFGLLALVLLLTGAPFAARRRAG